jgi:ribonuclease-3
VESLRKARELKKKIEELTGSKLKKAPFLETALRHPSACRGGKESYQRLEFLGDAVFGLVVSQMIFQKFPHSAEGELSRLKANLVCEANLSRLAKKINLIDYLSFNRQQIVNPKAIQSIEAEALEAVAGALYLSSPEVAVKFIKFLFKGFKFKKFFQADPKSNFQEKLAALKMPAPEYRLIKKTGKAHKPFFEVEVLVEGKSWAKGKGSSKKEAETKAAAKAIKKLEKLSREKS